MLKLYKKEKVPIIIYKYCVLISIQLGIKLTRDKRAIGSQC